MNLITGHSGFPFVFCSRLLFSEGPCSLKLEVYSVARHSPSRRKMSWVGYAICTTASFGKEIIASVMSEKNVNPMAIPFENGQYNLAQIGRSKRYYRVKGFAWFNAHISCSRRWASAHSWCIVDLREQVIVHTFKQDCQKCERAVSPTYDDEAVRSMAEYAVDSYLRKVRGVFNFSGFYETLRDDDDDDRGPHDQGRCEMCKSLGRSCWK